MTALITILISLLGYGSPADYQNHSEAQLQQEIAAAEATSNIDGGGGSMEWP